MKKFLKIAVIVVAFASALSGISLTTLTKNTITVSLEGAVVGAVFLSYALIASYAGSVLMILLSFWLLSRRAMWFLAISNLIFFALLLNNLLLFLDASLRAFILLAPAILYLLASFRFFRKLKKGYQ